MSVHFDTIIIGGGHAGANLVSQLRRRKTGETRIALFDSETVLPYHKPPLSKAWLKGEMPENRLLLFPETMYQNADCTLKLGETITTVDAAAKKVISDQGEYSYDRLVLATGGRARALNITGGDDPHILTLRTRADSDRLRTKLEAAKNLIVIGGGYIGLEVAASARALGLEVTLLEAAPRVLERVTGPSVSAFYETIHRAEGVNIQTGVQLERFKSKPDHLTVETSAGAFVTDLVVAGIGLEPDLTLAHELGLATENGILVNKHCETSIPGIYAIGDNVCAPVPLYDNRILRVESVQNAVDQAACVAAALTGEPIAYDPLPWFWSDQYDLKLKMAGISDGYDAIIERGNHADRSLSFCYLKRGKLIAVDTINRAGDFVAGQKLIRAGTLVNPQLLSDDTVPLKALL